MSEINTKENTIALFEEIKPKRLSDEVYEQIKSLIFEGKLRPGDKLPPERQLAEAFNIGRACLREALNKLIATGLLETRKKDGYYVRSLFEEMIGPLKAFIESEIRNLVDFMEVRKMLDIWSAKEAIKKASEADLERIRGSLQKGGDSAAFHIAIAEATHNLILYHVISNMHTLISGISLIKQRRRSRPQANQDLFAGQHHKIYEAIANRDPAAAEAAILEHINTFMAEAKGQET
jgi:GntR family transcriptional repressor for pyruvate dehydrogenase complex